MKVKVKVKFDENFDQNSVEFLMFADNSGFSQVTEEKLSFPNMRKPLKSELTSVIEILVSVVAVAEAAITLYKIITEAKENKKENQEVIKIDIHINEKNIILTDQDKLHEIEDKLRKFL